MRNKWWAKPLRIVAILMMGLTAAFTLLGGAGTTCVALNPSGYGGKFAGIAPFQWLYILLFVIGTLAIGVLGVRAVVLLISGSGKAYRAALIALIAGVAVGTLHLIVSRSLRGSSMPVDIVLWITLLTLIVFMVLKIPAIWDGVNLEKPSATKQTRRQALAIVLFFCGVLALTIQFLMAPTHTIGGINYADVWHVTFGLTGAGLVLSGAIIAVVKPEPIEAFCGASPTHPAPQ